MKIAPVIKTSAKLTFIYNKAIKNRLKRSPVKPGMTVR